MTEIRKNKPLNVCFVSPKAYPLFNPTVKAVFGGAEVDLYILATELAKDKEFQVSCITADYNQPKIEHIENVKIIKSLNFKQNQITGAIKIWKAMKKANAGIYMIESASPGVPLTTEFCRLNNKKLVYRTAHQRECDGSYISDHFILGKLFARSLRTADVITQNDEDRDNLMRTAGIDSVVIRNAHRLPDVIDTERKTILWVGRSADFKKPYRFLDMARRFPQEQFIMICQRATSDNDYESLIEQANKVTNLKFIKRVPFNETDNYFLNARVYVNTSDSEGFPNTFVQAGKCAAAILSYKVNPDNFLGKYDCGISCDADPQIFSDSLAELLKEEKFHKFGANGRKYVEQQHDIAKIVNNYKELFKKLK